MSNLAYFYWDPNPTLFYVSLLGRPVMWYGLLFVMGFILGYFLIIPIFKNKLAETKQITESDIASWSALTRNLGCKKEEVLSMLNGMGLSRRELEERYPNAFYPLRDLSQALADKLMWFVMGGTLIGARLGHVLFYEFPYFSKHPGEIIKIWEGGLASHGGTIGVIIGLLAFVKWNRRSFPELNYLNIIDLLCIPAGLAAFFIRLGNFVNQEIIGTPTDLPWAIVFGHPADASAPVPRHPTQLYEALAYLATFFFIFFVWKTRKNIREGVLSGLFFICIFGARFCIEFTKVPLSQMMDESFLQTGQLLSIPFILLGIGLCFISSARKGGETPPPLQSSPQDM